jgi:outer membrane protein assembly factor BamB
MRLKSSLRFISIAAVFSFAAMGCSVRTQALPNLKSTVSSRIGPDSGGSNDDWTTFAYDYKRTGYNPNVARLSRSNVSKLRLRWKYNVGEPIFASPVAYAGNVIIVAEGSTTGRPGSAVYDFRASDGQLLWKFPMDDEAQMTPSIDPDAGLVIVANQRRLRRYRSNVFALRLLDGSLVWRQPLYGTIKAAPVVDSGLVFIGRAGGDPPRCLQGGITALDESTGQVVWSWHVDPKPKEGGSVWGAIAYDGSHLIFGTGNTCQAPVTTANGAVALTLGGNVLWNMVAVKDSEYDSDTGGGVMLFDGRAHFINKNGRLYAVDAETGNIKWTTDLNPYTGPRKWRGGFATPTTDGTIIVEGSGLYTGSSADDRGEFCMLAAVQPTEVFPGFHSKLQGMDLHGHVLWARTMQNRLVGYVALAQGIGFVGLNKHFVAFDSRNGRTLWSYATPDYIDASMVVVPSGVYGADDGGNVYALALPSSTERR